MRIVRAKTDADLQVVASLDSEVFYNDPPISDWSEAMWWIGYDGKRPVCYAAMKVLGRVAYLSRAGVIPKYRGLGLQSRLIRTRLAQAARSGCRTVITYTEPTNCASGNSLIRCGFKMYLAEYSWAGPEFLYWQKEIE